MSNSLYLRKLTLASMGQETGFLLGQKLTCYSSSYPFKVFPAKELSSLSFAPITILYGGNGSGKTTLLNIIAEKAKLTRHSAFSGSAFFQEYVDLCSLDAMQIPEGSQILTSDDVSDYLLNIRHLNDGIDARRDELLDDYTDRKYKDLRFTSLADYDSWKEGYDAKRKTKSAFVRERLMRNVDMHSNGETAMKYYVDRITEDALYLIDEPENSLSAKLQMDLVEFIAISARYSGCQFVISTHSPFLLSLPGAKIYDLDSFPVQERKWTELENVRIYYDFFMKHQHEFDA